MRRVVERRQDNPEDIEDSKWRRKSYALAQHNALPVPMPLPAYPPPKVVPLPTTAPARRPRAYRPPPPTYRPTNGTNRPLAPTPEVPAGMTRLPSHLPPTPEHPPPPEAGPTESLAATSAPAVPVRRRNAALQRQTASPSTPSSMDAEHLPPTPPLTSSSSSPPSPTSAASLSHLPPTPTSQVFPPTPSLSRSGTPTSLSCPRTPTSIRAAPWQPPFVEKSAASPTPSQTPPAGVGTAFPPTPSSTRSHTADNGVTPASSVSSLNNVMTESKPQAPPPTAARLEEVEPPLSLPAVEGPVGKTAVAPSILSAEHLHAQIKNVGGDSWRVGADAPPPAIPRDQDKKLPDEDEAKGAYKTYYTRFWILAVFSTLALPAEHGVGHLRPDPGLSRGGLRLDGRHGGRLPQLGPRRRRHLHAPHDVVHAEAGTPAGNAGVRDPHLRRDSGAVLHVRAFYLYCAVSRGRRPQLFRRLHDPVPPRHGRRRMVPARRADNSNSRGRPHVPARGRRYVHGTPCGEESGQRDLARGYQRDLGRGYPGRHYDLDVYPLRGGGRPPSRRDHLLPRPPPLAPPP
nr:pollen-specific leucine-rich repeat extensin-like protein 1 [Penaeus vannamei]